MRSRESAIELSFDPVKKAKNAEANATFKGER
jgi:hypothetical protein